MVTMDYLLRNRAAGGSANPVQARPGIGRWFKSQLPGGEKAMGLGALKSAVTSPAMVRAVRRGLQATMMGGAPTGWAIADRRMAGEAMERAMPIPSVAQIKRAVGPGLGMTMFPGAKPSEAGKLARAVGAVAERVPEVAANPVGAALEAADRVLGGGAGVTTGGGQQWYPQGTGDWSGEPGGRYLSARYARQYGSWGMTYAGEGWRAIADRQGWDARLHPGFTQANLRYQDRPYVPRSGSRLFYEEL